MYFWVDLMFGHVILDSLIEKHLLIRVHKSFPIYETRKCRINQSFAVVIFILWSLLFAFYSVCCRMLTQGYLDYLGLTFMIFKTSTHFLCWLLFICVLLKVAWLIENHQRISRKIAMGDIMLFLGASNKEEPCCIRAERMSGGTKLQIQQSGFFKCKHKLRKR